MDDDQYRYVTRERISLKEYLWLIRRTLRRWVRAIQSIPSRIRQGWYRLWIRKDEFHRSLDLDAEYMLYLDKAGQKKYTDDLVRRREIAHQRDLNRS